MANCCAAPSATFIIALYKPKGYVTTVCDPEGRPTVMDLLKGVEERVFPVGRLDYTSEGLLLLTNDGELMPQLTKAASHVAKTYMVKVSGAPTEEEIDKLRDGITCLRRPRARAPWEALIPAWSAAHAIRAHAAGESIWCASRTIPGTRSR